MKSRRSTKGRAHVAGFDVTLTDGVATCCGCPDFNRVHFFARTECEHMVLINRPLRASLTDEQVAELVARWMWWIAFIWWYDLPENALLEIARQIVAANPGRFPNRLELYPVVEKKLYRLGGTRVDF